MSCFQEVADYPNGISMKKQELSCTPDQIDLSETYQKYIQL
jgi:hypothetical protein